MFKLVVKKEHLKKIGATIASSRRTSVTQIMLVLYLQPVPTLTPVLKDILGSHGHQFPVRKWWIMTWFDLLRSEIWGAKWDCTRYFARLTDQTLIASPQYISLVTGLRVQWRSRTFLLTQTFSKPGGWSPINPTEMDQVLGNVSLGMSE